MTLTPYQHFNDVCFDSLTLTCQINMKTLYFSVRAANFGSKYDFKHISASCPLVPAFVVPSPPLIRKWTCPATWCEECCVILRVKINFMGVRSCQSKM